MRRQENNWTEPAAFISANGGLLQFTPLSFSLFFCEKEQKDVLFSVCGSDHKA